MRKNLLKIALAMVIVATGSYGSYKAYSMYETEKYNGLILANIEALSSDGESGYSCTATLICLDGGSVSCTSTKNECYRSSYLGYVECDGKKSYC